MDIYKYADEVDADYMDPTTGNIFHVQEYNRMKKYFNIDGKIRVSDGNGKTIGYARKSSNNN